MALRPLATRARDENPNYIATLYQPATQNLFRAWVPETFNLRISNDWEPIFGEANETANVLRGMGINANLKLLSQQIWLRTHPLEFEFTFMLDAYSNTKKDIDDPIMNLIKMSTPRRMNLPPLMGGTPDEKGLFLEAPGPTLISNEMRIFLRIGRMFFLDSIVINDIDVTYYTISDIPGSYMSADVNVSVTSAYTPDQQDIIKAFRLGRELRDDFSNLNPGDLSGAPWQNWTEEERKKVLNRLLSNQDVENLRQMLQFSENTFEGLLNYLSGSSGG